MKTKFGKILCVILVICVLVGLTGCSLTTTTTTKNSKTQIVGGEISTTGSDANASTTDADTDATTTAGSGNGTATTTGKTSATKAPSKTVATQQTQNAGTVDNSKEKKLSGKLELQIFTGGYGSEIWEYAINAFEKVQPDVDITAHMDANVNAQMKTRWAKNNPPDFVFLEGSSMPAETWMSEGKLMDLTDLYNNGYVYGTNTKIKDQLKDGLVFTYSNTNKVYQMPMLTSMYGIWYDSALFTKKGWSVPTNYTQLKSFCATAKKAGIDPLLYTGLYSGYAVWGFIMPTVAAEALESNDLNYFYNVANATSESVWSDKRFKNVLSKWKELADAGYFHSAGLSMDHISSQIAWLDHKAALLPNGLWLESEMEGDTPDGFAMRYYPAVMQDADQKTPVIMTASSVGIATHAKNPDAAKAFLRFLYTDEISVKINEMCSVPAATKTSMASAKLTAAAKQVNDMINSSTVTVVPKASTTWGSVDGTINDVVNKIVKGEYTVDKAISALQTATKKKNS